jgi:hypothetical protein
MRPELGSCPKMGSNKPGKMTLMSLIDTKIDTNVNFPLPSRFSSTPVPVSTAQHPPSYIDNIPLFGTIGESIPVFYSSFSANFAASIAKSRSMQPPLSLIEIHLASFFSPHFQLRKNF